MLEGVCKPHYHKNMTNSILMIQLKVAFDEHVRGPPGANNSDCPRGVMAPGLKDLASVDDISGSFSGGWGQFVGPRCLLVKVRRNLSVLI